MFPSSQFKRAFVDASYTLSSGRNSGIERVVRNLSSQLESMDAENGTRFMRQIISNGGKFIALTDEDRAELSRFGERKRDVFGRQSPAYKLVANAACKTLPLRAVRKWLLPKPGHLGIFKIPYSIKSSLLQKRVASGGEVVTPRSGDLFILPDAYWVNKLGNTVWPATKRAREAGAKVATVIYDLIPLTHPQFVGSERSAAFHRYLLNCAQNSDLLLTISQTVRDDVQSFLREHGGRSFCPEVQAFELGCELNTCQGHVRREVQIPFDGQPPYLTVSTFDPRKNHDYLLDAFDRVWKLDSNIKLVLVGRIGSRCDATVQRILNHPMLGKQLFLFSDLDDAELQYCYRNACGVIFPSIVEGFGLPIVESLWFRQKTFASDTKIHREVGKDDCSYFDLEDCNSLVDSIQRWEERITAGHHETPARRNLTSWRQSALQVIHACEGLAPSSKQAA